MTRQVHELGREQYGHLGHITSLNPIRPENVADTWETKALQAFKSGVKEVSETSKINGSEYLRFMRPMFVEDSCLKCHGHQGYKEGDLRGGISISIPMEPLKTLMYRNIIWVIAGYCFVWLIGLGGIELGVLRTGQHRQQQAKTQKGLEESVRQYKALARNMSDGMALYSAVDNGMDFVFRDHNLAGERISGLTYDQVIGSRVTEVFPGVEEMGLLEVLQRVWKSGKPEHHPTCEYKDKQLVLWVENSIFKLPSGEVVAVYRDLTENKQAEESLRQANTIINQSPVVAFLWENTENWPVRFVSENIKGLCGYSAREFMSGEVFYNEIIHSDDLERVVEEVTKNSLTKNNSFVHSPYRIITRNNGIRWIQDTTYIGKNSRGEITHFEGIVFDITERRKMEDQLLISEKMTTIAGLAAGVAHEINTPLSGILQAAQLIEMGLDPGEEQNRVLAADCGVDLAKMQDYLEKKELGFFLTGIRESAVTAAHIVADLLQFSRPQERVASVVNLAQLIDRSIELAKTDYSLKKDYNIQNVTFVRHYSSEPLQVNCLDIEIEQVLINLIQNACQAMTGTPDLTDPQIILCTKQNHDMAVIEVEDNGPGIAEEIRIQIFDPFFTTKDVGQGTGLGLSVSYSIICDKHGGTIRVESTPGKGTRFIIELPMEKRGCLR